jgi:hypothetical protein
MEKDARGEHPIDGSAPGVYICPMSNRPRRVRISSPSALRAQYVRSLKQCIRELKSLCSEAAQILTSLLVRPPVAMALDLCARFRLLQARFSVRYHEAKALALSAIGSLKMVRTAP